MIKNMKIFLSLMSLVMVASVAAQAQEMTFHGRLVDSTTNTGLNGSILFKVQVRTPTTAGDSCVMYEEQITRTVVNGVYVLRLNAGLGARTDTTGYSLQQIFSNKNTFGAFNLTSCDTLPVVNWTPAATDSRRISISFYDSGTMAPGTFEPLPTQVASYVPMSIESVNVGGFPVDALLRVVDGSGNPASGLSPLSNTQYDELIDTITGNSSFYLKSTDPAVGFTGSLAGDVTGTQGATSVVALRGRPLSATAPASGQTLQFDGTSWVPFTDGGGTVTSVTSSNAYITVATSQTTPVITLNVGTVSGTVAAGNDTRITNAIQAGSAASGDLTGTYPGPTVATVGGKTAAEISQSVTDTQAGASAATASVLVKRDASGNSSFNTVQATNVSGRNIYLYNNTDTNYAQIRAPVALGVNYILTLPATAPVSGTLLMTNGSGDTSWVSPSAIGVTNVTASSPLASSGGSTPNITITRANGTTDGYLASADWTTFNNKMSNTLSTGMVWVGNGSNAAAEQYLSITNIRSTIIPVSNPWFDVSGACAAGSTLTYSAVTDKVSCAAYSITSSQVTTALGYTPVSNVLPQNQILVGNASGTATAVGMTGDASIVSDGTITIANDAITNAKIANLAVTNAKINDVNWNKVTSTPTTIAGYGITDAILIQAGGVSTMQAASYATLLATPPASVPSRVFVTRDTGEVWYSDGTSWILVGSAVGSGGTVTNVTASSPLSVVSGTTTPLISISQATNAVSGYLTSADWTTFNTKLSPALGSAEFYLGNAGGVATAVTMSGDATMNNAGVLALVNTGVASGTYSKVSVDAKGRVTAATTINSSDVTTALGYTPVDKAGDSMSGSLTLTGASNLILSGTGKIAVGAASADASALVDLTSTSLGFLMPRMTTGQRNGITSPANGLQIFNVTTNSIEYFDGGWKTLATTSGSLSSLNGLGASVQVFAVGSSGSDFNIQSVSDTHTFNIPTASGAAERGLLTSADYTRFNAKLGSLQVDYPLISDNHSTDPTISIIQATAADAGFLTSTDWSTFNSKLTSNLASGSIFVGNASGSATGVAMTGDASIDNTGVLSLASSGVTSGTYGSASAVPSFTVDSKGRITAATSQAYQEATAVTKGIVQIGSGLAVSSGTVSVLYGSVSATAVEGNDPRLSDARTPTGPASGDLSGTYPNPTVAAGAITNGKIANLAVTDAKINDVNWNKIVSTPTTVAGYGITDAILTNAGGVSTMQAATYATMIATAPGTVPNRVFVTPDTGEVYYSNGVSWTKIGSATGLGGTVTNVTANAPLSVVSGTTTPVISISQSSATADGYLTSADWSMFNAKVNRSGDTMTGSLIMNGGNIVVSGTGKIGVGTATPATSSIVDLSSTSLGFLMPRMTSGQRDAIASPVVGLQIFNTTSNSIDYYNGSSWLSAASTAGSLSSLNGLTAVSQTFAVGSAGSDFAISSAGTVHTFDIPSASVSNRGLLTSADWSLFNAKLTSNLASGTIFIGNSSGSATSVTLTGDGTLSNSGVFELASTGVTSGTYSQVSVDAKGRVTAASVNQDLSAVSGTLAVANGGTGASSLAAGSLVVGNGTSAVNMLAAGGAGNVLYAVSSTGWAAGSPNTAGLVDLYSTQTISGDKSFSNSVSVRSGNAVRFYNTTNSNSVVLQAANSLSSDLTFRLPATPGISGQVMVTDGAGNLNWTSSLTTDLASGTIYIGNGSNIASGTALTGDASLTSSGVLTLASTGVTSGTYSLVSVDVKGRVVSGSTLTSSDISSIIGYTPVKSVSVDLPLMSDDHPTEPTLSIMQASSINDGFVTSSDWSLFNSKLTSNLASGTIFVGNSSGSATSVVMTGDASLNSNGALTISNSAITNAKIANNAVTDAKIGDVNWSKVVSTPTTVAGYGILDAVLTNAGGVSTMQSANSATFAGTTAASAPNRVFVVPDTGEIYFSNGVSWTLVGSAAGLGGTVTNVTANSPLSVTSGTSTPVVSIARATATADGYLASTDWSAFNAKVNRSGDTMTGALVMDNANVLVSGTGKIGVGTATPAASAIVDLTSTSLGFLIPRMNETQRNAIASPVAGLQIYNTTSGSVDFYNGSSWQQMATGSNALSSLNGLTAVSQTFTVTSLGTDFSVSSSGSVHSFNIPSASSANRGLLTAADWSAFNSKLTSNLASGTIFIGDASGSATSVATTGDVALSNSGVFTLATTGVASGTYTRVSVDAKGRVTNGGAILSSDITTSLGYAPLKLIDADVPLSIDNTNPLEPIISMPNASASQDGYLQSGDWSTFNSKLTSNLASGTIFVGNASGSATSVALTGDASISNSGVLSLASTGVTSGTYSKVSVDAKGRVTSATNINSTDVTTALTYTPVNRAGDSMSGALVMDNANVVVSGTGRITVGTATPATSAIVDLTSTSLGFLMPRMNETQRNAIASPVAGLQIYNTTSGSVDFYNGTSWQQMATGSNALSSLNGLTAVSQTFTVTSLGTDFSVSSSGSVHSFNIPSASSANRGLLTATDWSAFNSKLTSNLASGTIFIGDASGSATSVALTGDASLSNSGALTLASTGVTSGTYTRLSVDAKGRVTSGGAILSSDITTSLGYAPLKLIDADVPLSIDNTNPLEPIISMPNASASQDGYLQSGDWSTFNSKLTSNLASGTIFVGNSSGSATSVALTGDASLSNSGLLSLSTTGVTSGTYSKVSVDAKGRVTSATNINSTDVTTALTYAPVNRAGDTMTGALILDNANVVVSGTGKIGVGTATPATSAIVDLTSTSLGFLMPRMNETQRNAIASPVAGLQVYNTTSGSVDYYNGTSWQQMATGASALNSLNGLTATSQTFTVTSLGTDFSVSSSGSVHSFNIPSASSANRGLLTAADWSAFNSKLTSNLASGTIFIGDASGSATSVALTGDASLSNSGALTLASTGVTSGTYTRLSVDAKGRVTSGGAILSSDITTSLGYAPLKLIDADVPLSIDNTNPLEPIISMPNASASQDGYLQSGDWSTFNSKLTSNLASGTIFVGNASGSATSVALTGDASISNSGVLSLASTGVTSGTYSKVSVDAKGRVTSAANINSADVTTALTYTPVNRAGDTMSGALILDNANVVVSGTGRITVGTATPATSAIVDLTSTSLGFLMPRMNETQRNAIASPVAGLQIYNTTSGTVDFYNGSGWQQMATGASALNSLNGLTAVSQTFTVTGLGTDFSVSSSGSVHSFNVPSASSANRGLLTAADWSAFNSKLTSNLASGTIFIGDASGSATSVATSGDVALSNSGVFTLATTGVASGTYTRLSVDAKGRVTSGGAILSSDITTSLGYAPLKLIDADVPLSIDNTNPLEPIISMPNASASQDGYLQSGDWSTFNSKLTSNLASGTIFIGNASGSATSVALTGDVSLSNSGLTTLATTGVASGTYSSVSVDAKGRVTSGAVSQDLSFVTGVLGVANGGTGANSITTGSVMIGGGTGAVTSLAGGAAGNILYAVSSTNWAVGTPNTAGIVDLTTTQSISGDKSFVNSVQIRNGNAVRYYNATNSNYVALQAPAALSSDLTVRWPASNGAASQVLTTDGSGNLSWATPAAGGITSLNGLGGGTQTFAVSSLGSDFSVSSSGTVHEFNIPSASDSARGLLTAADWSLFNSKLTSNLASGTIFIGNASGSATSVAVTGDVSLSNSGVTTLATTGVTSGTYTRLSVDAKGRVTSGGAILSSDITTSLGYAPLKLIDADVPLSIDNTNPLEPIISMPNASASQDGYLQSGDWSTFSSKLTSNLASGTIFVGNASGSATSVTVTGDVSLSNSGVTTLATTGVASGTYSSVSVDAKGRVTSGAVSQDLSFVTGVLGVANGGTGANSITAGSVMIGGGTGAVTSLAGGAAGNILYAVSSTNWAVGTPNTAGLVDLTTTQSISGDKSFVNSVQIRNGNTVRYYNATNSNYVAVQAPATLSSDLTVRWPASNGSVSQVLTTDGSGNLSWATPASGGITSLNGLSGGTQTFTVTSLGTDFSVSSSGTVHSFNIPSASSANRGLLTAADWSTFNSKLTSNLASGTIFIGNASGSATSVAVTGDVSLSNSGVTTLATTGVASGTYTRVSVDAKGRVTSGGAILSSDITTSLGYAPLKLVDADIPMSVDNTNPLEPVISMPNASGSQDGYLQSSDWSTFNAKLSPNLASGTIFIGNASGSATSVAVSGDASISNSGILSLATTGVGAGTYSRVTVDTKGRVTSGAVSQDLSFVTGVLGVANGGTGANSITAGSVMIGGGTSAVTSLAGGAAGNVLYAVSSTNWAVGTPNTAGLVDLTSTQSISGDKSFVNSVQIRNGNAVRYYNATNSNYVAVQAPASLSSDLTVRWPASNGSVSQVLTTDGSGNLSWSTPSAGGISSLNGLSGGTQTFTVTSLGTDFSVSSSGTVHSFNIPSASSANRGLLTAADWSTFNSKLTSNLASGTIFIGNASGSATSVATTGDVALSNSGVFTLASTGITSGTYSSVSVDAKGRVTAASANQSLATVSGVLAVPNGGTGLATVTSGSILIGAGTSSMTTLAGGATGNMLYATGAATWASGSKDTIGIFANNGNTFGVPAVIGTLDSQPLNFMTAGGTKASLSTTGALSVSSDVTMGVAAGTSGAAPASPSKLTVNGQAYSNVQIDTTSTTSLAWDANRGNVMRWSTASATLTVTATNMQPGGAYMLVVKGAGTGTTTITCNGTAAKYIPANGSRTGGTATSKTVYTIMYDGEDCLVTWITGY